MVRASASSVTWVGSSGWPSISAPTSARPRPSRRSIHLESPVGVGFAQGKIRIAEQLAEHSWILKADARHRVLGGAVDLLPVAEDHGEGGTAACVEQMADQPAFRFEASPAGTRSER